MRLNSNYYPININRWNHLVGILFLIFLALITYTFGAEVGEGAGEQKETMLSLLKKGGPVMFPLGIASILALALGLERFISLSKEKEQFQNSVQFVLVN